MENWRNGVAVRLQRQEGEGREGEEGEGGAVKRSSRERLLKRQLE